MKTLREIWTDFFSRENLLLSQNYPGLNLQRFLLEVGDILKLRSHPLLKLDHSIFNIGPKITKELEDKFLKGIPFAYLTHSSEFYRHTFYVNENVLIPRQETELLVDHLVQIGRKKRFGRALDVGTGSGVIILSLLDEGAVESAVASDLSPEALKVARINAERLRLVSKCEFILSDRFQFIDGKFDLIVSNPPYIKSKAHRSLVHQKVAEFEPEMALYIPDESYDQWFADFFMEIKMHLNPGGLFMMEGHELELERQGQKLRDLGFMNVKVINDLSGPPRFLEASL